MTLNERLPDKPDVTFDFNLPHGIDFEDNSLPLTDLTVQPGLEHKHLSGDARAQHDFASTCDLAANGQRSPDRDLNYRQSSPGIFDDEDSGETFESSWSNHQAERHAAKVARGRKSPRRASSDGEVPGSTARVKKVRRSLFGDNDESMQQDEQVDSLFASATPGFGIGQRLSSLNLEQQQDGDEDLGAGISTGFGLACSDIGSVRDSPAPSDDEFEIPQDTVPYYELRQNTDRKKAVTHVDTDKSGNWDPDMEGREKAAKLNRAKAAKKEKQERRKDKGKANATKDYVMKFIVQLPFESFGNVRNITNDEQNWPDDWSDIDSEQEREFAEYREHYRARTPGHEPQVYLKDPAAKVDDLTGHPAARGCKQCRRYGQACSLVDGGGYPCKECIEDGNECHLIREPTEKDRCKQCDEANIDVCSFENDSAQPSCTHCSENGLDCEALPPHGYKAQRLSVDEVVWGPDRPFISCTTCRGLKKKCSLKTMKDKPPCKWCSKHNNPCRFVEPPKPVEENETTDGPTLLERIAPSVAKPGSEFFTEDDLANMHRRNTTVLEREPTPELEMVDPAGNLGVLTKITTSFAHPMKFHAERSEGMSCNFCDIPVFGMFGHFERVVHVIRWHSGLGFAEMGGGHAQDEGVTRMCHDCTNQRLQIIVCPGHEFERIPDSILDSEALAEELVSAEPGGADIQYQLSRWCSMCFSPAVFGCSALQPDLCGEEETEISGCHLRLCEACEVALRTKYEGNFDAMAADMNDLPKVSAADETLDRKIEGRSRADVGLLMRDGLLMRVVNAGEQY